MIVDYGTVHQVCKVEVPALMPTKEDVQNSDVMKQRMYAFLGELVPSSMRGKELFQGIVQTGLHSVQQFDYEHVTIAESRYANEPFNGKIWVTFKNDDCPKPVVQ
jgi:hypothetical protein